MVSFAFLRSRNCLFVSSLLTIWVLTAGCGGGSSSNPSAAQGVVVSVTPAAASVQVAGTKTFTAAVTNTTNTAVTWQVNGVAGGDATHGSITPTGTYTGRCAISGNCYSHRRVRCGHDKIRLGNGYHYRFFFRRHGFCIHQPSEGGAYNRAKPSLHGHGYGKLRDYRDVGSGFHTGRQFIRRHRQRHRSDPATKTIYLVSKSKSTGATPNFHQRLHALSLIDGSEKFNGPQDIAFTSGGNTFDPLRQNQRAGLALVNGVVYIAYASHGDVNTFYGWIVGYSASSLAQVSLFNDDPVSSYGGIWMSGGAPAADSSNNLYVITGNGAFDGISPSLGTVF